MNRRTNSVELGPVSPPVDVIGAYSSLDYFPDRESVGQDQIRMSVALLSRCEQSKIASITLDSVLDVCLRRWDVQLELVLRDCVSAVWRC